MLDKPVVDRGLDPTNLELEGLINRGILGDLSWQQERKSSQTPTATQTLLERSAQAEAAT